MTSESHSKSRIEAFLQEPERAEEVDHHLDMFADLFEVQDRQILHAAFEAFLPDNAEWYLDAVDDEKLKNVILGMDLMLKIGGVLVSKFRRARLQYMRASMALVEGDIAHAKAMLVAAIQTFPKEEGRHLAGALFQLADILAQEDQEFLGYTAPSAYFEALKSFDPDDDPILTAQIRQSLGLWHSSQGVGARDKHLIKAVDQLRLSISIFDSYEEFTGAALSRIYLAYTLTEIHGGEQATRIEEAIKEAEAALMHLDQENDPTTWAMAHSVLGSAWGERVVGRRSDNLARAVEYHEIALKSLPVEIDRHARIQSLINLSAMAISQADLKMTGAAEQAIRCCDEAIDLLIGDEPAELPLNAWLNLSTALSIRKTGEQSDNMVQAGNALKEAQRLAEESGHPFGAQIKLNRAIFEIEGYRSTKEGDLQLAKELLDEVAAKFSAKSAPAFWLRHRRHAALIAGIEDDWGALIQYAEEVFHTFDALTKASTTLDEKRRLLSDISDICDLGILAEAISNGPGAALRAAAKYSGRLFPDRRLSNEKITEPGHVQLHLFAPKIDEGAIAVIRSKAQDKLFILEKLGFEFWKENDDLSALLSLNGEDHIRLPELVNKVGRLTQAVSEGCNELTKELEDQNIRRVDILPTGAWGRIPFAAIETSDGALWGERFDLSLERVADVSTPQTALHIFDPKLSAASDESAMLANCFKLDRCDGALTEVQDRLLSAKNVDLIHFTSHGRHDLDFIDGGGVICSDGNILSARWIYENLSLKSGCVVVLAACETGLSDHVHLPNEEFSLPNAFIRAGAGAVLSTLWPVDDLITRIFSERFYEALTSGVSPIHSLKDAQQHIRDLDDSSLAKEMRHKFSTRLVDHADDGALHSVDLSQPYFWAGYVLHQG